MSGEPYCVNCGIVEGNVHGDCMSCGLQLVTLKPQQERLLSGIEKEFSYKIGVTHADSSG